MSPSDKPDSGDGDVMSGLPRTRPQRRSTRRAVPADADQKASAAATPAKKIAASADKPPSSAKAPADKAPATASKKTARARKAASAKTTASAKKATAKARAASPPAQAAPTNVSEPLLDHPAPAAMPGAPFAPPSAESTSGRRAATPPRDAKAKDATGADPVSAVVHAAGNVVQAGVDVAKAVLGRLPRP